MLQEEGKADSLQMLTIQFCLATTLCHEFMHAIRFANIWQDRLRARMEKGADLDYDENEPYFEDQEVAEVGFAW